MVDLRRISVTACLLIVALRMAIGWQFLYEGLWKLDSQSTATPWTSEGYLKNAQGPFRDFFRNMTGDPDDTRWMNYETMSARWDAWRNRFLAHYPDLTDGQKQALDELLDGPAEYSVALSQLPEGVEIKGAPAKVVRYDAKSKRLIVSGVDAEKRKLHMVPRERDELFRQVELKDSKEAQAFLKAVDELYKRQAKLAYRERLLVSLKGDPSRAGQILDEQKGTVDYKRMGDIQLYDALRERYEELLKGVKSDFQRKHLERTYAELMEKKGAVIGPVKALEKQLQADAFKILTGDQMARGTIPPEATQVRRIDTMTIWSLIILGGLLVAGLFSRPAALVGAGMVLMFYLPMPPWPGVPEPPGPEHSFIVNKNLIEVIALLAIAFMPTGQWFGVDRWFQKLLYGRRDEAAASQT